MRPVHVSTQSSESSRSRHGELDFARSEFKGRALRNMSTRMTVRKGTPDLKLKLVRTRSHRSCWRQLCTGMRRKRPRSVRGLSWLSLDREHKFE